MQEPRGARHRARARISTREWLAPPVHQAPARFPVRRGFARRPHPRQPKPAVSPFPVTWPPALRPCIADQDSTRSWAKSCRDDKCQAWDLCRPHLLAYPQSSLPDHRRLCGLCRDRRNRFVPPSRAAPCCPLLSARVALMRPESPEEWASPDSDFVEEWVLGAESKKAQEGFLAKLDQNHDRSRCHSPLMVYGLEGCRENSQAAEGDSPCSVPVEPDCASHRAGAGSQLPVQR